MIPLRLAELNDALGGTLTLPHRVTDAQFVDGQRADQLTLVEPGSIFFALPGEVTDGHLFASDAVARGAALIVAERPLDVAVPLLVVPNGVDGPRRPGRGWSSRGCARAGR